MTGVRPERWAVVGGGMLGLTLAHRLSQAGRSVTLYEGAPELGGLAAAWSVGNITWDRHYHVTLLSDTATREVLGEIGLGDQMQWVETKTGFYAGDRLYPMSNAVEYLRLPALSMIDKARLGTTILAGSRIRNWKSLEQQTVTDWLTRWSGRGVVERLWVPLLRAKLGESYHDASAAFIWATIQRLYAARRTGMKKELFGYVPGGYAHVLTRFSEVLRDEGVEVRTGTAVSNVRREGDGVLVTTASEAQQFDSVVVTANPPTAIRILDGLTAEERDQLSAIRYQGVVCASIVLRRPLAPYYLTYITEPDVPFTAVVEMSAFVDRAEFSGQSLVYLPKYVAPDDPLLDEAEDTIIEGFLSYLRRMYPVLTADDVLATRVSKVRAVFPVPTLGYSTLVPGFDTSIPGVHLVSSAQIVNGTLNVNDTVKLAESAAAHLLSDRSNS